MSQQFNFPSWQKKKKIYHLRETCAKVRSHLPFLFCVQVPGEVTLLSFCHREAVYSWFRKQILSKYTVGAVGPGASRAAHPGVHRCGLRGVGCPWLCPISLPTADRFGPATLASEFHSAAFTAAPQLPIPAFAGV